MRLRFYDDPDTLEPHFFRHGVSVAEIVEFFHDISYFEERRDDGSFMGYGRLESGRYLKVVYRKLAPDYRFIITAYDLEDPVIIAYVERNSE